jgi:hypothetical protein
LLELVDESILHIQFSKVILVRALLIKNLSNVGRLDGASVGTHRDAFMVDFLLVDSRGEEDIECRVFDAVYVIMEDILHLLLLSAHLSLSNYINHRINLKQKYTCYHDSTDNEI